MLTLFIVAVAAFLVGLIVGVVWANKAMEQVFRR